MSQSNLIWYRYFKIYLKIKNKVKKKKSLLLLIAVEVVVVVFYYQFLTQ